MDLWEQAQFKAPTLKIMLTDKLGSQLGTDRVNVSTGRIQAMFRREDVSIDEELNLVCGDLPFIQLSESEAEELSILLGV